MNNYVSPTKNGGNIVCGLCFWKYYQHHHHNNRRKGRKKQRNWSFWQQAFIFFTSLYVFLTSVSISISQNDSLVSQHLHSLNEWMNECRNKLSFFLENVSLFLFFWLNLLGSKNFFTLYLVLASLLFPFLSNPVCLCAGYFHCIISFEQKPFTWFPL